MRSRGWWDRPATDDRKDRVDDRAETPRSREFDDAVDDLMDFAREMVACAMAPLRELMAEAEPAFGRHRERWQRGRARHARKHRHD